MVYSLPGSSVHGLLQARILEWLSFPSAGGSSPTTDQTWSSTLQAASLPSEPPGKPAFSWLSGGKTQSLGSWVWDSSQVLNSQTTILYLLLLPDWDSTRKSSSLGSESKTQRWRLQKTELQETWFPSSISRNLHFQRPNPIGKLFAFSG